MAKKKKNTYTDFPVRPEDQKLLNACSTLNYQKIKAAIQAGGNVNTLDRHHKMSAIDFLTEAAVNCFTEYRKNDFIRKNILKIIMLLLSLGADPDGATKDDTPLHFFSWQLYDWDICSELIRSGAKINRILYGDHTALDYVSEEIMFLEICDDNEEENRQKNLKKLDHLYNQMIRHGALHYSELKEKQEKDNDLG